MISAAQRRVGDELSATEYALLTLLCSGQGTALAHARAQLPQVRWAGTQYEDCLCPALAVPRGGALPRIGHDGGPLSLLEVFRAGQAIGFVELWVQEGYLHSLDYISYEYDDEHVMLPDPGLHTFELITD